MSTVFFTETFDTYSGQPPWPPLIQEWRIRDGTVTLIDSGVLGRGQFVDLGGSTGDPGVLYLPYDLFPGFVFTANFELADSSAPGGSSVTVQYGDATQRFDIAPGEDFTTHTLSFQPKTNASAIYELSFSSVDGSPAPYLDNVVLSSTPVPEAGGLMMGLAGWLVACMFQMRRSRSASSSI